MPGMAQPFVFEIHLVDGQEIKAEIGADDFERMRATNTGWQIPPDSEPRMGAARLFLSMLLYRIDNRAGFTGVRDTEGRNWLLPGSAILAFSYRDPESEERQLLGFQRRDGAL